MAPTPRDILGPNEIWFGDTFFPISKPVQQTSITVVPNPVIFGDTAKRGDTQTLSQFMQSSAQGGSGIYRGNARTDAERSWTSECDTRFEFLTLPPLDNTVGKPATAGATTDVNLIMEYASTVYVAWGSDIFHVVDGVPPTWSTVDRSLPATPTDWEEFRNRLYVASGARVDRRPSGGVWDSVVVPASYIKTFASKLYAIGLSSGVWQLQWTASGDFTEAAPAGGWPIIGESDVTVRGMVVYRDALGNRKLYISTDKGFWVFDENSVTISQSDLGWAADLNAGKTPLVFRDGRMYTTLGGLGVLQVQSGNPILGQPIGLDRDQGVPTAEQGAVVSLTTDSNFLYAMVDGTLPPTTTPTETVSASSEFAAGEWDDAFTGISTLRAYSDGPGWHRIWTSNGSGFAGTTMRVSQAYNKKRLYWGADRQLWYIDLAIGLYNPRFNPNQKFTARPCRHTTPWWFLTSELETKLTPHFLIEVQNVTPTESVDVYYGTDLNDASLTLLTTVTGPGLTVVKLNSGMGVTGRWFRFVLDLRRGTTVTARPLVIVWGPQFMPMLTAEYGFALNIDLTKTWRGLSPQQMKQALERLADPLQTPNLVEFAFEDDLEGVAKNQTYLARIMRFQAMRYTGRKLRGQGQYMVSVIAPSKADAV
jgi:hypothetical protein